MSDEKRDTTEADRLLEQAPNPRTDVALCVKHHRSA